MPGGARAGSGAKKGQRRVHVQELRDAIEKMVGIPFQEVQAKVFCKLFTDFQQDTHIKEFLVFNEHMGRRLLEDQAQEFNISDTTGLTNEQLRERAALILKKANYVKAEPD